MMITNKFFSLIGILLFAVVGLFSQKGSMSVKIDRDTLGLDDVVKVEFILENLQGKFTPPDFTGFRVVSGPNYYSSYSMINGRVSEYKSYQYLLSPVESGLLEIGAANVSFEGKEIQTSVVPVFVESASKSRRGTFHQFKSEQESGDMGQDKSLNETKKLPRKPLKRI